MAPTPTPRKPSAIDAIADAYVTRLCELDPLSATSMGVKGYDHLSTDLSPAGIPAPAHAARAELAELHGAQPQHAVDEVTLAAMRERIGHELAQLDDRELHPQPN